MRKAIASQRPELLGAGTGSMSSRITLTGAFP